MYIKLRKVFVHTSLNHPVNRVRDHSYETVTKTWLRERWPCLLNGQVNIVLLIFAV